MTLRLPAARPLLVAALLGAGVGSTPGTGVDSFDREGPLEAERETAPVGGGVGFTPAGIGMSPGGGLCVVGCGTNREWENGGKWLKAEMKGKGLMRRRLGSSEKTMVPRRNCEKRERVGSQPGWENGTGKKKGCKKAKRFYNEWVSG